MSLFSGVYGIRHMRSHKIYVGSTTNLDDRWNVHLRALRKGEHHSVLLQRAWNKYGEESFEFLVLEGGFFVDRETLISREQFWMDHLHSYNPQKGYNISKKANGPSGERISATIKENWANPDIRSRMLEGMKKYHETPEAKAAMSRAGSSRKDYSKMAHYRSLVKNVRNQFRLWTAEDDAYLHEHYAADGVRACAEALKRSPGALRIRASQLGLRVGNSKRERYRQAALVREAARRLAALVREAARRLA